MFEKRLTQLREEKGISKKEAANALDIPYTTYLNYENDIREPNSDTLIKIAKLYNVSIDYLLGMSNVKTQEIDVKQICEKTGLSEKAIANIKKFCLTETFGMIYLNKLLECLEVPYIQKKSPLYEMILYLHLNWINPTIESDYFALYTNNALKKISFKQEKTSSEICRISEHELVNQILINNIIEAMKKLSN